MQEIFFCDYQCWKQFCLINIFVEALKYKQNLFKIEIVCKIIHAFTLTIDQLNVPVLKKRINFFLSFFLS